MTDEDKTYLLKELTRTIDESDSTAAFCLCQRWILKDALALLKEQEAVEPRSFMDGRVQRFACTKCGKHLLYARWGRDNYCSKCGQKVKWDD